MIETGEGSPRDQPEAESDFQIERYFTTEFLRDILQNSVIKGNYKLPNDEALRNLGAFLDDLRFVAEAATGHLRDQMVRRIETRDALSFIESALPHLFDDIAVRYDGSEKDWIVVRRKDPNYLAVNKLALAIKNFKKHPFIYGNGVLQLETMFCWKNYAQALRDKFCLAMLSTNPHKAAFGISNGGPVARFISSVTEHITHETVAPETISAAFKRHRREGGIFPRPITPG